MKNSTIFKREIKTEKYTVISNSIIQSMILTAEEKVILIHILSLPDDWKLHKSHLEKLYSTNMSTSKFNRAWKGLRLKGYIVGEKVKDENGKYSSWKYEIRESPIPDIKESDISETEVSENRIVEKSTSHNLGYKESTNQQSTYEQSTKRENTNDTSILGKNQNRKKVWTNEEIQIDINSKALDDFFGNSGILWKNEIYSTTKNEFMSRYQYLDKSNGDKLEYLYSTYLTLNKNNSQLP
jgi:hypothetical protein